MAKQKFNIELVANVVLELDDAVIAAVDAEWRRKFYNLTTPEEVAKHIAFNLIANGARLGQLDGWADQPDQNASVVSVDWEVEVAGR